MTTDAMPSTTHSLSPAHRLRLLRSTRKLSALLGETPLVVDSASHLPVNVESDQNLTSMSEDMTSSRTSRPHLFIRLPSVSQVPTAPLTSPLTPTFGSALNFPAATGEDAARRRKMAKLSRTLGENVPPELVYPTGPPRTTKSTRRASTSESSLRREGQKRLSLSRAGSGAHRTGTLLDGIPIHSDISDEGAVTDPSSVASTALIDLHASSESLIPWPGLSSENLGSDRL
ncbi:hypothetical protein C8J57DRAFT_1228569 [Mycena rebaudengoi]|nr:hypothetical protein C8J57DRAFT_1228569 [Mycena rebaudengoi]